MLNFKTFCFKIFIVLPYYFKWSMCTLENIDRDFFRLIKLNRLTDGRSIDWVHLAANWQLESFTFEGFPSVMNRCRDAGPLVRSIDRLSFVIVWLIPIRSLITGQASQLKYCMFPSQWQLSAFSITLHYTLKIKHSQVAEFKGCRVQSVEAAGNSDQLFRGNCNWWGDWTTWK